MIELDQHDFGSHFDRRMSCSADTLTGQTEKEQITPPDDLLSPLGKANLVAHLNTPGTAAASPVWVVLRCGAHSQLRIRIVDALLKYIAHPARL
jgi:hypothetical protein